MILILDLKWDLLRNIIIVCNTWDSLLAAGTVAAGLYSYSP